MKNTESVLVILEGGLVRDVLDVPSYDVLDLDVLEEGTITELREGLELAEELLPLDYADREEILNDVRETLAYLEQVEKEDK